MPLIQASAYRAKGVFQNAHINTIYPSLFRRIPSIYNRRERLYTPDDDFLDVDWVEKGNKRLVIALHGLEGSSQNHYVVWMLKYFSDRGWDGLGVNFRSCSGEMNKTVRSYNMGETEDIHFVIKEILSRNRYDQIILVGFSLGGNVCLNYFGREPDRIPEEMVGGLAFSVPCHLTTASRVMNHWSNKVYLYRFLISLNQKAEQKSKSFPNEFEWSKPYPMSFDTFDERYTAPVHGYNSAVHYWDASSSSHHFDKIERPVLLINAIDDPFLSKECFPKSLAKKHPHFYLEMPKHGGHIGFVGPTTADRSFWTEQRAFSFVQEVVLQC